MNNKTYTIAATILLVFFSTALAKSKPVGGFTVFHIGEPKNEEPFTNKIPHGESAINCICEAENGLVFAGTRVVKGTTPWILCYNPALKSIPDNNYWPLKPTIDREKSITAIVAVSDGYLYGSTSNMESISYEDYKDVAAMGYKGGHLFRFKLDEAGKFMLEDLGIPVPGNGISAIVADIKREMIYGIASPGLILFSFSLKNHKTTVIHDFGGVEILRNLYVGKAPSAIVVDDSGCVYSSERGGRIFKYNPVQGSVTVLKGNLPTEGEGQFYDAVTAFTKTPDGRIFGGTFIDGKLFELVTSTGYVKALGITGRTGHLRGMAEKNGIIYGFSGSKKIASRLFVYKVATGEYKSFPEYKVYYKNSSIKVVPFQMESIVLLRDGSFALGENSDNGHLYIYEAEEMEWNK